jgi:glutamate formiminotransferase/formiminotetrahydrofolate cyclodeaminase
MSCDKLVECVPNFSEGRDSSIIDAIARSISSVEGVCLLDVDPGADANRTVYTFAGHPPAVLKAALAAARTAFDRIDMTRHFGAHPRIGALDVCPFVPLAGATMEDCVELAISFGDALARELSVPVYLYEKAARRPGRESLAAIRSGGYEGLRSLLARREWEPDFGPAVFVPRWGATVVGARNILIAYNVNLDTEDVKTARDIAAALRESGRLVRGAEGGEDENGGGGERRIPGLLKAVRAIGWYMEEYRCAQVSMNILDYHATPMHVAFEAVKAEAEKRGVRTSGSQLVGLAPLDAICAAGRHYLAKSDEADERAPHEDADEADLVGAAIRGLGLSSVTPFDPERKIIEFALRRFGLGPTR